MNYYNFQGNNHCTRETSPNKTRFVHLKKNLKCSHEQLFIMWQLKIESSENVRTKKKLGKNIYFIGQKNVAVLKNCWDSRSVFSDKNNLCDKRINSVRRPDPKTNRSNEFYKKKQKSLLNVKNHCNRDRTGRGRESKGGLANSTVSNPIPLRYACFWHNNNNYCTVIIINIKNKNNTAFGPSLLYSLLSSAPSGEHGFLSNRHCT